MSARARFRTFLVLVSAGLAWFLVGASLAGASAHLLKISEDPYSNPTSQH